MAKASDVDPINIFDTSWFESMYTFEWLMVSDAGSQKVGVHFFEQEIRAAHIEWVRVTNRLARVSEKIPFYNSSTNKIAGAAGLLFHCLNRKKCFSAGLSV